MTAALSVVDDVGLDGLTIRAVASLVGAPPMSLYAHFAHKEGLLDLMYGEIARLMYADTGEPGWQTELAALCQQIRSLLSEHPNWIPLLARPAPPIASPLRERLLKMMVTDGMSPEMALTSVSSAVVVSIGLVLAELNLRDAEGQSAIAKRYERLRVWVESDDSGGHPVTRMAMSRTKRLDLDALHTFTIRALIAGLSPHEPS